jgi:hypothetical protein
MWATRLARHEIRLRRQLWLLQGSTPARTADADRAGATHAAIAADANEGLTRFADEPMLMQCGT